MSRDNKLISGGNKGAAARFFEDWFTFSNKSLSTPITKSFTTLDFSTLIKKAETIKATGGKPCGKTTSQGFKVRKNDRSGFVGAFCQSNVGDVTPNVLGAFCTDTGKPCDFNRSSCNGNDQLCVGRGPGYPDEILSTKIIGERQFQKAVELFNSATNQLSGKIDYRHAYLNFTNIEVELDENTVVKTCPPALGPGFAAGTTDGPGVFGFQQEFTTMAGRRLREAVRETLISNGNGEFDDETHVVIAGLTNTYSQYVATFDEYKQQRYESASTLYGPHTLSAYIREFKKLAKAMAAGEKIGTGLLPPDLSSVQISLLLDPMGDSPPPGKKFGDMKQDVAQPKGDSYKKGDKPSATFWSANPRYDLLTEGTFAVVEMLQEERWIPVYDDDDFCLYFKWKVDSSSIYGLATIEWEVPEEAASGVYRLRHFGSSKKTKDSPNEYFTGASSAFTVS